MRLQAYGPCWRHTLRLLLAQKVPELRATGDDESADKVQRALDIYIEAFGTIHHPWPDLGVVRGEDSVEDEFLALPRLIAPHPLFAKWVESQIRDGVTKLESKAR